MLTQHYARPPECVDCGYPLRWAYRDADSEAARCEMCYVAYRSRRDGVMYRSTDDIREIDDQET